MAPSPSHRSQEKTWILGIIGLLLSLMVPFFAAAQDTRSLPTMELEELRPFLNATLTHPLYQPLIQRLREVIRERHLGNIYQLYRENPALKLGALPLNELFQGLEKFNIFQNNTNSALVGDPQRESDFYIPGEFWGIMNTPALHSTPNRVFVLLGLHIFLGSAGFDDEHYQLTLALILYNQALNQSLRHPDPKIKEPNFLSLFPKTENELYLKKAELPGIKASSPLPAEQIRIVKGEFTSPAEQILLAKGGFTGVGRGGDSRSVQVKLMMAELMYSIADIKDLPNNCRDSWRDVTEYLRDVLSVRIESKTEVGRFAISKGNNVEYSIQISKFDPNDKEYWEIVSNLAVYELCKIKQETQ